MSVLAGEPSDSAPAVLASGVGDANIAFVSASAADPAGLDGRYLEWHTYDHRPEQHRLPALRASMRLMSTTACQAARVASSADFERVKHVMTYFFASAEGLAGFTELFRALDAAGRMPLILPAVDRGVYARAHTFAAPRIKIGSDVLPWWPARSVFLLIERNGTHVDEFADVPGVAGVWSGKAAPDMIPEPMRAGSPQDESVQITYCYLDEDPSDVSSRLRPVLEARWADSGIVPLLAAPFVTVNDRRDWEEEVTS